MVHVPNLEPLGHPQLIAAGWLDTGKPFAIGRIGEPFVGALLRLMADPWQPGISPGFHRCGFCRITGGPAQLHHAGRSLSLGVLNLYVPAEGRIFVSPSLIAHYADAHEYCPPQVYQDAVVACPPMRSMEYLRAILRNSPPSFSRGHYLV
jgi:hypothetical protein